MTWAWRSPFAARTETPELTLTDLAVAAVMAESFDELSQVIENAHRVFGPDALDLNVPDPCSDAVLGLNVLIAREAGRLL